MTEFFDLEFKKYQNKPPYFSIQCDDKLDQVCVTLVRINNGRGEPIHVGVSPPSDHTIRRSSLVRIKQYGEVARLHPCGYCGSKIPMRSQYPCVAWDPRSKDKRPSTISFTKTHSHRLDRYYNIIDYMRNCF